LALGGILGAKLGSKEGTRGKIGLGGMSNAYKQNDNFGGLPQLNKGGLGRYNL
jgi:hypothetical protein